MKFREPKKEMHGDHHHWLLSVNAESMKFCSS